MLNKPISADCHMDLFYLPADAFTSRTQGPMKDRVPKVVNIDEKPVWVGDGTVMGGHGAWHGSHGRQTSEFRGQRMWEAGWDPRQCRPSNPRLRIEDQDLDGIAGEVIFGLRLIEDSIKDPEVVTATYRAFNDFMAEFSEYDRQRLIGIGNIPAHSPDVAAAEIRRVGKEGLGLRGVLFDWFNAISPIWNSVWEPMWAAAEESQVAICFHVAAGHGTTTVGTANPAARLSRSIDRVSLAAAQSVNGTQADECLASMILCGALEKHTGLKMVLAECGVGWIPHVLERMDGKFKEGDFKGLINTLPSELFQRQVWATFIKDAVGIRLAEDYAPDSFCWSSDYPHRDGLWPDSQKFINESMGHISQTMRQKLTHDNVARLFSLE